MPYRPGSAALRMAALLLFLLALLGSGFSYWVGGKLLAPRMALVGPAPEDLQAESVIIPGRAGSLHGWWIPGDADKASVLLLHGIRADRTAMLGRARLLARHGYSVLLIDLQAHGESPGEAISLGLRESTGVQLAREWIRRKRPGKPIGAIGVSLGGASILLGPSPSGFDAVVLEAVYADARQALQNRMAIRFGPLPPCWENCWKYRSSHGSVSRWTSYDPLNTSRALARRCWSSRADGIGIRP